MHQNETNFRLALMSIEEVRLATENVVRVVNANHKTTSEALSQQVTAINSLATTLSMALEGFQLSSASQNLLLSRVSQLEADVSLLKSKAS